MLESMPKTTEFVFTSPSTNGKLIDVKKGFRKAVQAANISDFRFHDLRHTCGTRLADKGVNLVVIAEILGHSDLRTVKRYCHAMKKTKQEAMQKLTEIKPREQFLSNSGINEKRQVAGLAL